MSRPQPIAWLTVPSLVSRSPAGYTGAPVGFELYVHPERAPAVWSQLLALGEAHGVQPAGLAARDSTRTEAGLPLHGHELAGPYGVSPIEAGYGGFVKLHKPFFPGRAKCLEAHKDRYRDVERFEVEEKGDKVLRAGMTVLEVGPGMGFFTLALAEMAPKRGVTLVRDWDKE